MTIKRIHRKTKQTAEEEIRVGALREKYQRAKPGPDQVADSGKYDGSMQAAAFWEVRRVMAALKVERERQALSLALLAERSGIDEGAISRLETGRQVNPSMDTLSRIAAGLGMRVGLLLELQGQRNGKTSGGRRQARATGRASRGAAK
jgi:hypothetical protein